MRRTLALAGAAVLAVGLSGLASPASASDNSTTAVTPDIAEIAVELNNAGPSADIDGDYIVIRNLGDAGDLDGFGVRGCTASSTFMIAAFDSGHTIAADGFVLVANSVYNSGGGPLRDVAFATAADTQLDPNDGGVQLFNASGVVDNVNWGNSESTCADPSTSAPDPTATQSLHKQPNGSWILGTPTPRNTAS